MTRVMLCLLWSTLGDSTINTGRGLWSSILHKPTPLRPRPILIGPETSTCASVQETPRVRLWYPPNTQHQQLSRFSSMCKTAFWRSGTCSHRWVTLVKPCADDRNFGNCPYFANGTAQGRYRGPLPALANTCPECDKKNDYDGDATRMVTGETEGIKFGSTPDKHSGGVEIICCVIQ